MQTLAYLGSLMRAQTISNAIIVCPKSVVRHWERDANLIIKNMCAQKVTIYAVTSDVGKEKRKKVFSDAFCSSVKAPPPCCDYLWTSVEPYHRFNYNCWCI